MCWMGCLRGAIVASLGAELLYVIQLLVLDLRLTKGGLELKPRLQAYETGLFLYAHISRIAKGSHHYALKLGAGSWHLKSWDVASATFCDPTRHRHISGS